MGRIPHEQLAGLQAMQAASMDDVVRCAPLWRRLGVGAGQVLWPRGQVVHELGILLKGQVVLQLHGETVISLGPGAILGEEGAFFHALEHSIDVVATTDAAVATLPSHQLRALREARSTVYESLVRASTASIVRRVRASSLAIAQAAQHDAEAPGRQEVSALVGLWRKLVPGGPKTECPPLVPLLRQQPGIEHAPPEAVMALTGSFERQAVSEGEVVFLEGERGDAMYLIAAGSIDVLRHVRGGAKRLVTLGPGAQFGCNALVEPGPRTASCVAKGPGWLYRISAEAFRSPPRGAGVIWWESVLHNLADQARRSDSNLAEALALASPEPTSEADSFKQLLDASGFRNVGDIHTSELAEVEVGYSDEQIRNWRN